MSAAIAYSGPDPADPPVSEAAWTVLALPRYAQGSSTEFRPRNRYDALAAAPVVDLVVLDRLLPEDPERVEAAIQAARTPALHDPTADARVFRVPRTACLRWVGPPGTRLPAEPETLAELEPHRCSPHRPSADDRARIALRRRETDQDDLAFALALMRRRKALIATAIQREHTLAICESYWQRVRPILAAAQAKITQAWLATGNPSEDVTRAGNVFAVFDPDAERIVAPLSADDADARRRLTGLCDALDVDVDGESQAGLFLLVPMTGPVAELPGIAALEDEIRAVHAAIHDGHAAYARARDGYDAQDAWIDDTLTEIVAAAEALLGPEISPVEAALRAFKLDFVNESGGCPILGPNTPIGDELGYQVIMTIARPAEAVRALYQPRAWPNLYGMLDACPALRRAAEIVHARAGDAHLELSGSTDIRRIRRPGLVATTRFAAMRTGEQRSLTVPLAPGMESPFTRLRPGQILRVNERKASAVEAEGQTGGQVNEQIDLMVTRVPRRLNLARLNPKQIERLAHREGITAEAYRALLERQGGGIVVGIVVVAERSISAEQHRERQRERVIVRRILREMERGREREIER